MSAPANKVAPWEDFVLRTISVWKLIHAVFFTLVGFGLLRLRGHSVVDFLNNHLIVPYHLNPESHFVDWMLVQAQKISPHTLFLAEWVAFIYAAVFAAEGIGLFLRKRWAEWLVVFATGGFLPLEVYELFHKEVWWKFVILFGNLLIVGYLIHRLTLDFRIKSRAEKKDADDSEGNPPSGLQGGAQGSENRRGSPGAVSTKAQ